MIPDAYFDRFATAKYRAKNPLQRALIRRFVARLHDLFLEAQPARSMLEVGVGEGFLSGYLSEQLPEKRFHGVDLREEDIARLRELFPRIDGRVGSAYDLSAFTPGEIDLVLCAEVLEHLDTPERALDEIARLGPKKAIFTVPHEPFFMLSNLLRGKNVSRFGNDPEHVGHFGAKSFRRLLEGRFRVLRQTSSYPWLLALVEPR